MRVLVPYDGSGLPEKAAEYPHGRYDGAGVVLIRVLDLCAGYEAPPEAALPGYRADCNKQAEESAEKILK